MSANICVARCLNSTRNISKWKKSSPGAATVATRTLIWTYFLADTSCIDSPTFFCHRLSNKNFIDPRKGIKRHTGHFYLTGISAWVSFIIITLKMVDQNFAMTIIITIYSTNKCVNKWIFCLCLVLSSHICGARKTTQFLRR